MHKLTIAVFTYNRANYLVKMLDSIQRQTYTEFDVIIYDNCSEDNTQDVVKPYLLDKRFSYYRHEKNIGAVGNGNYALKNCKTDYLLLTHDDDIMLPDMVLKEIEILETHHDVVLVSANINFINSNDDVIKTDIFSRVSDVDFTTTSRDFINQYMKRNWYIVCPTVMLNISYMRPYNLFFKEGIGGAADTFFWLEINQLNYSFYHLHDVLYNYRRHEGQDSEQSPLLLELIKNPVYELLKKNNYPQATIDAWVAYINSAILHNIERKPQKKKNYIASKNVLFLMDRFEARFRIKFYLAIYMPFVLKCIQFRRRVLRKLRVIINTGKPEIIAIISGGLGNQMSLYAMSQEIQRINNVPVRYDVTWFEIWGKTDNGEENRLYELEKVFPAIKVKKAGKSKIAYYQKNFYLGYETVKATGEICIDELDLSKPPIYLGCFWESDKYTNYDIDKLRAVFSFGLSLDEQNRKMLEKIQSTNCPVALQIRGGDYRYYRGSVLDIVTPKYFHDAIDYVCKRIKPIEPHFFVFFNDKDKRNECLNSLSYQFTYVDINDNDHGAFDMYLMSQCHHFIISNSSFGFWPALLSNRVDNKIVVQPDKKSKIDTEKLKSKYPGWVNMEC